MKKPRVNLLGRKFGKGIVVAQVPKPAHVIRAGFYWSVQCECGEICIVDTTTLKTKWTNCGCVREENLVGRRFHLGTVMQFSHKYNGYRFWLLKCDCGKEYKVKTESLISDNNKSCGCLNKRIGKDHPRYKGYNDISGDYWNKLKKGAKIREIDFTLDIKDAWELYIKQDKKCTLTNWPITLTSSYAKFEQTASLDRINSNKTYVKDNVQWVHKDVNRMKQDFDENYLAKVCEAIIANRRTLLD